MDVRGFKIVAVAAAALKLSSAQADGLDLLPYALSGGTPNVDFRVRYEKVELEEIYGLLVTHDEAEATTARLRVGYTTGKWNNIDAQAELESVSNLGSDHFNSTRNKQPTYTPIPDPEGGEVNQAWVRYSGVPKSAIKIGRQRLIYDNARFIGNVGWRQNEQTYDGATFNSTFIDKTTVNLAYLTNVNSFRSFRSDPTTAGAGCNPMFACKDDLDLKATLVNIAVSPLQTATLLTITPYLYDLDFDFNSGARADTSTLGLRVTGAVPYQAVQLTYLAEYAEQSDYKDAPKTVDADYTLVELGVVQTQPNGATNPISVFTAKIGYELLSGDGVYGFQTPLSTVHAHDGWADLFLATPALGLERLYANLTYAYKLATGTAVYHQFKSDEGSDDYGDEIDLLASYQLTPQFSVTAKYAHFSGDYDGAVPALASLKSDTTKTWAYVEYKF